ncbi:MAG: DUF2852 domain-containing protein [Hyphomicrobiales bacterium]|nr:DUF2852 domain-containing protein [Hyphomicrobiales bacterium]
MHIAARHGDPPYSAWPGRPSGHVLWHAGPVLVGLAVLGLFFYWPLGIVVALLALWSAKMSCGFHHHDDQHWGRWQERMASRRARWEERMARHCERHRQSHSSGNRAFDAYRDETLRRLEDEEREFREFLDRLRFAKDKAEFDDFLANRRPPAAPAEPDAPPQN